MATKQTQPSFSELLISAVNDPGTLSHAYTQFHDYSMGNMLLAWAQCLQRGIDMGPMRTYQGWKKLGRHVLRGSKAIVLCQPVTFKRQADDDDEDRVIVRFTYRAKWFVMGQTGGKDVSRDPVPGWDRDTALESLDIEQIDYASTNGNGQGYATERKIAINPVATNPAKTTIHEIAHVLLGHTTGDYTPDSHGLGEVEAETVAFLVGSVLGLPGASDSRGYIQHWNQGNAAIPEPSARRILRVADKILRAGRPQTATVAA